MSLPILYSFRRCPWAMRARVALHNAGVQCELREVDLKDKPCALLEASPKGTVPVLVLPDGTVIDESLDIIRYALEQHDPEGWAGQGDPTAVNALLGTVAGEFAKANYRYKYYEKFPELSQETYRQQAEDLLIKELEDRLSQQTFLFGDRPSVADVGSFSLIRQFAKVEPEWWENAPYPKLRAWLGYWLESSHFTAVMEKHAPWQEGDAPVLLAA